MFRINEVIRFEGSLCRILAFHRQDIVWIPIENSVEFPSLVSMGELIRAIDNELLKREDDPFSYLAYETPEEGSTAKLKRDKNYALIRPLVQDENFFMPEVRIAFINHAISEKIACKQTLYRLLRRYWQRGQTVNALLPDYKNSGGRGKKRRATNKKLGRPRKFQPGIGAIVDEHIERLFRRTIEKHMLTKKKHSFVYSYRKFTEIFNTYHPDVPESEIPTIWQMKHFYKREYEVVEQIEKRVLEIDYNKDIRPLHGTANTHVLGPGSRFEIDATIADIYLVSDSVRRNIVGRPIVYMVIDVFSRMVAGFYIGFENPSYVAALQALSIAMTDKVELCKRYGFEIESKDWPVVGLPDAILADRGELLGYQIEALESCFSVRIENSPPYRGDAKGIVERSFKTMQAEFKPFAPGVVEGTKVKKYGGSDYRLDACMTVREFTEIIIASILHRNRYHPLEKYDRDVDMPANLPMTPLSIWNWGLQYRTGRLRTVSEDALRISLLPRTKATFSAFGACIFGVYYSSKEILKSGWMHRIKGSKRPHSLEAAYDPCNAERIYIFPNSKSNETWLCRLTERSREFTGASFWDVWRITAEQKAAIAESKLQERKRRQELDQLIEEKIKLAKKLQPESSGVPSTARIRAIRGNRSREKEKERKTMAALQNKKGKATSAKVVPLSDPSEDYKYPDMVNELFEEDD